MRVSIIINNYNYSRFVRECLKSAAEQTYSNVEIIIVDDGSTDDSRAVISSFLEECHRPVEVVFKENGGQASAFNAGFSRSTGDLVLFLDSDDFLTADCAEQVVANWEKGAAKLHFDLDIVDCESRRVGRTFWNGSLSAGDFRNEILERGAIDSSPTSGNVFARLFLDRVMPIPEAEWAFYTDTYLFCLAALEGPVAAIDAPLGYYRVHGVNGSAHTYQGKCVRRSIERGIEKEILTDDLLENYAKQNSLMYRERAFTDALGHKQIVFIYTAIFGRKYLSGGPWAAFKQSAKKIISSDVLPFYKKVAITIWQMAIVALPAQLREKLIVWGYQNGFVIAKNKSVEIVT